MSISSDCDCLPDRPRGGSLALSSFCSSELPSLEGLSGLLSFKFRRLRAI